MLTEIATIEKKITSITIDLENNSIGFTVRERTLNAAGLSVNEKTVTITATGPDFVAIGAYIPDATLSIYANISQASYAYISGKV